jgi:hypothetical protein
VKSYVVYAATTPNHPLLRKPVGPKMSHDKDTYDMKDVIFAGCELGNAL